MRRATTLIVLAVAGVLMTAGTVWAQTTNPSDGIEAVDPLAGAAGAGGVGGTAATGADVTMAALAILALVIAGLVALFIARRSSLREDAS